MKKRKQNNKLVLFTIFAVILTIIALIATSGTYAKYTGSIDSTTATATVAKWEVIVNDKNLGSTENFSLDLFNSIKDTDGYEVDENVDTGLIAPGTSGSFDITIENKSQVDINYAINLTKDSASADIPIKFAVKKGTADVSEYVSIDDANWNTLINSNNELDSVGKASGTKKTTIKILWKWDYEVDETQDSKDTVLGSYGTGSAPQYIVTASVVATQID